MAVDVFADRSTFKAGTVRALFKTKPGFANHVNASGPTTDIPYDVTEDGQRFLFTERIASGIQAGTDQRRAQLARRAPELSTS